MKNKIKEFFQKKDNLVILVLTGILLLVISWPISDTEVESDTKSQLWYKQNDTIEKNQLELEKQTVVLGEESQENFNEKAYEEQYLETKLEDILSAVYGVGRVKVMITLADSGEKIIEKDVPLERNNIVESDASGGNRNTNEMNTQETTVYVTNAEGDKLPYVVKETSPMVEGVTVVAEGAGSAEVQKNISDVIQALFGIEAHKIIVVKMKQEG